MPDKIYEAMTSKPRSTATTLPTTPRTQFFDVQSHDMATAQTAWRPQSTPNEFDFDDVPNAMPIPDWMAPEQVEAERKRIQRKFYNSFANSFHKAPKSNFSAYRDWVETLPEAQNPLIRAFVLDLAKQNMPSSLRREYVMNQQRALQKQGMEEQLWQSIEFNKLVEDMKAQGQLPATAFYDPKTGKIAHDQRLANDQNMTRYAKIRFDVARKNLSDARRNMADTAEIARLEEELDAASQLLDRAYGVEQTGSAAVSAPSQQPTVTQEEIDGAIEFIQQNPNDPRAQAMMQWLQQVQAQQ